MKTTRISLMERIFLALVVLLLSGVEAQALPEASCNQTLQDFQKIKTELQQAKAKNPCSVVLNAKISKYEKSNSCAEVYLVADRTVAAYEAQRKSGCANLQGLVTKAKSCNPNGGANQAACFQAAAEAYEFASNFEKQMVGTVDQNLAKLGLVETAGQKALEKYQYDLSESKTAISMEQRRRDLAPDSLSVDAGIKSATAVKNRVLRSGITGDVNASDGGKKTIVEYKEALQSERGHIAAHSEALRFANDFRLDAEKLKKGMQQRISSFDQAAKDSRNRAQNSNTATDDNQPPAAQASGGSGISLPSLPSSAGEQTPTDSGMSSHLPGKVENSPAEAKKVTNSTFDKTSSKLAAKAKVDTKNVNRESISYQKSSSVKISGGINSKGKKSSRFELSSRKLGGQSEQNFESKGSALLGVLREKAAEEKNEEKARIEEAHSITDAGGDLEEKKDPDNPQPDELPVADGEEEGEANADAEGAQSDAAGEEARETASIDPSEVQEDLGFDLSTSLFDRVNRKLFQAYKTGRVIYDR